MMRRRFAGAALAAAICATGPVAAGEFTAGTITVSDPVIYEGPANARSLAGYFEITNSGAEADSLLGVEAEVPRAMLHESREDHGVMRMLPVDLLAIPGGASVSFEPGGLHVMLMGVESAPRAGDQVSATLLFEHAGRLEIVFDVVSRGTEGHATH